jgi:hypothetical protein
VSGYVIREEVKYTDHAFHKVATYKRRSKNLLLDQVESFRVGDKDNKREDDLLDTFVMGSLWRLEIARASEARPWPVSFPDRNQETRPTHLSHGMH